MLRNCYISVAGVRGLPDAHGRTVAFRDACARTVIAVTPRHSPVNRFAVILLAVVAATVFAAAQRAWDDDTHGRDALPDYERVFTQNIVKRIDIRVTAGDWERLAADMAEMAGSFGAQGGGGFNVAPDPAATAACQGLIEGSACAFGNPPQAGRCTLLPMAAGLSCTPLPGGGVGFPGGGPPGGGIPGGGNPPGGGAPPGGGNVPGGVGGADDVELLPRTPIYIPATVTFDDTTFNHVGLRLKGNSSLLNSWRSGAEKLPLRLNFDALESQFPDIRDQTFFGFPNLNLTNNSQDASFLRAKVVGDLFREAGVPAARTAFVRVFFDRGQGAQYLGLYTLVEVPDRPLLQTQFGSAAGNLYKPNGTGARWTTFLAESFPKKTNQDDEDWTDVEEAIAVLNEPRTSAAAWRARLEARFGVATFLRWLALNTIVGNTDTYGGFSPHNYWVYGSPRHRDRLIWIPWDHDLALNASGPGGGGRGGGPGGGGPVAGQGIDVFHQGVNMSWPLIRYLLDDPVYRAAYRQYVEEMLAGVFEPSRLTIRLQTEYARIAPYVVGADGEQPGRTFIDSPAQFTGAVSSLVEYVQTRAASVRQALGSTP
jgi:spore coat protein H